MSFKLELNFSRIATSVEVNNPTLISNKRLDQAYSLLSDFVMDALDELQEEVTDERFREIFIEICYRLVFREMLTLHYLPRWEERKVTQKGIGTYGD
jgi:hypothetical protein